MGDSRPYQENNVIYKATFDPFILRLIFKPTGYCCQSRNWKYISGDASLNNRESQKKIYSSFYGYAMSICHRYTNQEEDAIEILNDGFLKVFVEIYRFKPAYTDTVSSFKGWLRKIMIYTAIDHFRKNHKHRMTTELNETYMHLPAADEDSLAKISYEEIINAIKFLTPGYRTVLNLFIIEGFSHEEICKGIGHLDRHIQVKSR